MDLLILPTGLALLAIAAVVAGVVAWNRSRREAELRLGPDAAEPSSTATPLPTPAEAPSAHQAAAKAVIEQMQARAAAQVGLVEADPLVANPAPVATLAPARLPEPSPEPMPRFDGPAWAPTEPMPGMGVEPQFAETMPAEMDFGATNFADTLVTELIAEEPPRPVPGTRRRPA